MAIDTPQHMIRDGDPKARVIYLTANRHVYKLLVDGGSVLPFLDFQSDEQGHMLGYGGLGTPAPPAGSVELLYPVLDPHGNRGVMHYIPDQGWLEKGAGLPTSATLGHIMYWWQVAANPFNWNEWLLMGNDRGAYDMTLVTSRTREGYTNQYNVSALHMGGSDTTFLYYTNDAGASWIPITVFGPQAGSYAQPQPGGKPPITYYYYPDKFVPSRIEWSETVDGEWMIAGCGAMFAATAIPATVQPWMFFLMGNRSIIQMQGTQLPIVQLSGIRGGVLYEKTLDDNFGGGFEQLDFAAGGQHEWPFALHASGGNNYGTWGSGDINGTIPVTKNNAGYHSWRMDSLPGTEGGVLLDVLTLDTFGALWYSSNLRTDFPAMRSPNNIGGFGGGVVCVANHGTYVGVYTAPSSGNTAGFSDSGLVRITDPATTLVTKSDIEANGGGIVPATRGKRISYVRSSRKFRNVVAAFGDGVFYTSTDGVTWGTTLLPSGVNYTLSKSIEVIERV